MSTALESLPHQETGGLRGRGRRAAAEADAARRSSSSGGPRTLYRRWSWRRASRRWSPPRAGPVRGPPRGDVKTEQRQRFNLARALVIRRCSSGRAHPRGDPMGGHSCCWPSAPRGTRAGGAAGHRSLADAEYLCDRVLLMDRGQIVDRGRSQACVHARARTRRRSCGSSRCAAPEPPLASTRALPARTPGGATSCRTLLKAAVLAWWPGARASPQSCGVRRLVSVPCHAGFTRSRRRPVPGARGSWGCGGATITSLLIPKVCPRARRARPRARPSPELRHSFHET